MTDALKQSFLDHARRMRLSGWQWVRGVDGWHQIPIPDNTSTLDMLNDALRARLGDDFDLTAID